MKVSLDLNNEAFGLLMHTMPAIQSIFKQGYIPFAEEIQEFDEDLYALFKEKTGQTTRPMYRVVLGDDIVLEENVIDAIEHDDLVRAYKGIEFFQKYAQTHNIPFRERKKVFAHALKNAPAVLKAGSIYEEPDAKDDADAHKKLLAFLADGLDKDDVFKFSMKDETGKVTKTAIMPAYAKSIPNEIMSFEAFKEYTINALSQIFADEKHTVVAGISPRADGDHEVIHIIEKRGECAATHNGFLIEPYYEEYKLGKPLGEIVLTMLNEFEKNDEWMSKINLDDLSDFETAKNTLMVRLLNKRDLNNQPHPIIYKEVGDLALIVYIIMNRDASGISSGKLSTEIAKKWGLSNEYIMDCALENTARLFKPYLFSIDTAHATMATIQDLPPENRFFMEENFTLIPSIIGAYALFQDDGLNNATVIFYKGALKRLSTLLADDLYVAIADNNNATVHQKSKVSSKQLKKIFKRIKADLKSSRQPILSEKIYHYKRETDELEVCWE